MKLCSRCQEQKSLGDFHKSLTIPGGLQYECKACQRKFKRDWVAANRELQRLRWRVKQLKRDYGLSWDDYQNLLSSQGHKCLICDGVLKGGTAGAHVDHDHQTGQVRGILCAICNRGLGYFKDSSVRLRAAAKYLEQFGR